jgi:hypothetical protein
MILLPTVTQFSDNDFIEYFQRGRPRAQVATGGSNKRGSLLDLPGFPSSTNVSLPWSRPLRNEKIHRRSAALLSEPPAQSRSLCSHILSVRGRVNVMSTSSAPTLAFLHRMPTGSALRAGQRIKGVTKRERFKIYLLGIHVVVEMVFPAAVFRFCSRTGCGYRSSDLCFKGLV